MHFDNQARESSPLRSVIQIRKLLEYKQTKEAAYGSFMTFTLLFHRSGNEYKKIFMSLDIVSHVNGL